MFRLALQVCSDHYLILTIFFKSSTKEKRAGTKNIETKVESNKPPKTALPKPRYNSEPGPGTITSGISPRTLVIVDMKMGRTRERTDSSTASKNGIA
jgi:hypothetical protein